MLTLSDNEIATLIQDPYNYSQSTSVEYTAADFGTVAECPLSNEH